MDVNVVAPNTGDIGITVGARLPVNPARVVVALEARTIQRITLASVAIDNCGRLPGMLRMLLAGPMAIGALRTVCLVEKAEYRFLFFVTRKAI